MILFYWNATFYPIENQLRDRLTNDTRPGNNSLIILGIDSESLNQVGQWPWSREVLAKVTDRLIKGGAKAVWLDVLYTEESKDKKGDQAWQELVKKNKNVYLSSYFDAKTSQDSRKPLQYTKENIPIYDMPKNQLVHINTLEDADRIVRKALLGVPLKNGEIMPSASVRLANLLLPKSEQITWNQHGDWFRGNQAIPVNELNQVQFSYASSPKDSTIEVQPIYRVINGDIPAEYFKNRVVLIGPYAAGMEDFYYTPMSTKVPMYGVEIHANITQSLVENKLYKEFPRPFGTGLLIVLAFVSFFAVDRLKQHWAILTTVAIVALYFVIFNVMYNSQQVILPFLYPILMIIFVYIATIVFNYIAEQQEKKRVTGIFGRYVSQSVVDEILATGEDIVVGGERKDVTLMFVDIRGFTPLSEKMEPEEVIEILNEYLELCTVAVFEFGGTIDKFMGDGVMVIFGAPVEQEDHALRAAQTALRLQEKAEGLSKRLEERYGKIVAFGIGLNSGPAVVGNIGSKERVDYTAIGDTVNLAARLESNAKPNQVLISEAVYERIKDEVECTKLEPIKVKGKEKPVSVYQLEKLKPSSK